MGRKAGWRGTARETQSKGLQAVATKLHQLEVLQGDCSIEWVTSARTQSSGIWLLQARPWNTQPTLIFQRWITMSVINNRPLEASYGRARALHFCVSEKKMKMASVCHCNVLNTVILWPTRRLKKQRQLLPRLRTGVQSQDLHGGNRWFLQAVLWPPPVCHSPHMIR